MRFAHEKEAITSLAELLVDAGASLFKTTKYIYSLSERDFYHCEIKDVLKVILNNIFCADHLTALRLTKDGEACREMNTPAYTKVFSLIIYSFAVRLPLLRGVSVEGDTLSDAQVRAVYEAVMDQGIVNHENAIEQSFDDYRMLMRRRRPAPPYDASWYRNYLYRSVPELAQPTNRNMFLLGATDLLLVMFEMRLQEELKTELGQLQRMESHRIFR